MSPTAPRPGFDPADQSADAGDDNRSVAGPPNGAITLAELIADSGPLPADAALECVQRLAERLTRSPHESHNGLGPGDVLIDDDGGVWLRNAAPDLDDSKTTEHFDRMGSLGRLLVFLATGDQIHLAAEVPLDAGAVPAPLSTVAGRLVSRNGTCYASYADLASEAARLRGSSAPDLTVMVARTEEAPGPRPAASTGPLAASPAEPLTDEPFAKSVADETEAAGAPIGILILLAMAVGAALAYAVWLWL